MRSLEAAVLLVPLMLAGCAGSRERAPAGDLPSLADALAGEGMRVEIPALGLTLDVPPGSEVVHAAGGVTVYTQPDQRVSRGFAIEEWPPPTVHPETPAPAVTRKLPGGATLEYIVRTSDGGSGGSEAFLTGQLLVGGLPFAVHCHDQAEASAQLDPTWCLEHLATVRRSGR